MLLVLSREDRKYWLEVGYGLEDVVPDGSADEIVTSNVKTQLKAQNYDEAIALFLDHIGQRVTANQSAIATPAQITAKRARDAAIQQAILIAALILMVLLVLFFVVHMAMAARLRDAMRDTVALEAMPLYAASDGSRHSGTPTDSFLTTIQIRLVTCQATRNRSGQFGSSWFRVVDARAAVDRTISLLVLLPNKQTTAAISRSRCGGGPICFSISSVINPALADRFAKGRPYEASYAQWLGQQRMLLVKLR